MIPCATNAEVTVSIEVSVMNALRALCQQIQDEHGLMVTYFQLSWRDVSTIEAFALQTDLLTLTFSQKG